MKKLILTAAVAAIVGGFIGVAATPNETPDTCTLAFVKGELLFSLAADASRTRNAATLASINSRAQKEQPIYENLRDLCITGE